MTLNGVMAVILRYFSKFGQLPGALRKSSRSLSHLLINEFLLYTGNETLQQICPYSRPTRMQNFTPLAFSTVEKPVTVQTNKQTNKENHTQ